MSETPDLTAVPTSELLAIYGNVLTVLNDRNVVRSRNAPAGDLAETLTALAYNGTLARPSEKAWDVRADDGRLLQVKALVFATGKRTGNFSVFRSTTGFNAVVFVTFDAAYRILSATEVPAAWVNEHARATPHVNGARISASADLTSVNGHRDLTAAFGDAQARLNGMSASELAALRPDHAGTSNPA